jgi:hypothetical protein
VAPPAIAVPSIDVAAGPTVVNITPINLDIDIGNIAPSAPADISPGGAASSGTSAVTPLREFVDALSSFNLNRAYELIKVVALPLIIIGAGVSNLLIGGALIVGSIPAGPGGAAAAFAG